MRALVTGGNGFVAQWAIRAMLQRGWSVTAAGMGGRPTAKILSDDQDARVRWCSLDVTSQAQLASIVEEHRPDVILHLAAVSHVPAAAQNPSYAYEVNTLGTVRLLAEVARLRRASVADPLVLVVGSAEQYGAHPASEMPLVETSELRPLTVYAASKVAQEVAALQAFRSDGVRVICTRSFNRSGAGHPDHFLVPALVRKALALRALGDALPLGNVEIVRDYLHVTDAVSAYLSLLDAGIAGEVYNVSSGEGVTVQALAECVLDRVGVRAGLYVDPQLVRPVDVPVLIGNNRKLRDATGWEPRKTRLDIIDDLIHAATR